MYLWLPPFALLSTTPHRDAFLVAECVSTRGTAQLELSPI